MDNGVCVCRDERPAPRQLQLHWNQGYLLGFDPHHEAPSSKCHRIQDVTVNSMFLARVMRHFGFLTVIFWSPG